MAGFLWWLHGNGSEPLAGPSARDSLFSPVQDTVLCMGLLWLLGLSMIGLGAHFYNRQACQRIQIEDTFHRSTRFHEQLRELMLHMSRCHTMEEMLEPLLDVAVDACGMGGGGVYLIEGDQAVLHCHKGLPERFIREVEQLPLANPILKRGASSHSTVNVSEKSDLHTGLMAELGMHHAYSVALRADEKVFGFLNVASFGKEPPDPLNTYTLSVLALEAASLFNRLRVEEALIGSEARLQSIFRAAPTGIGLVVDRILKGANERLCEMTGYASDELLEQSARLLYLTQEDFEYVGREKYTQITEHGTGTVETRWVRKDGTVIDVLLSSTPLNQDDWSQGVTFTALDITDRKRTEAERLDMERQMQQAQKLESLGILAGGIAHDFNNILMAILGNADLALHDLSTHSPVRPRIEEIEEATRRASELAKQMLAYSGKGRFLIEPFDLNILVREMAHLLEVSVTKKIKVAFDLAETPAIMEGDATQIRQVIMNLITNASEALGEERGTIAIFTRVMECDHSYLKEVRLDDPLAEGAYICIEVADTGCGMDRATRAKIFDPFFTTKFIGRGLGLSAVLGIVRGHQGGIRIRSEPGKGTSFKVLFPASNLPPLPGTGKKLPDLEQELWQGRGTVLIVDDEETICTVGKHMVERLGFSVLTALNGKEGVALFEKHAEDICCVLLDLTMPDLDGEQTFQAMLRIREDVKVILCSGYNELEATQQFTSKDLAGFLQKPFSGELLRTKLMAIMEDEGGTS